MTRAFVIIFIFASPNRLSFDYRHYSPSIKTCTCVAIMTASFGLTLAQTANDTFVNDDNTEAIKTTLYFVYWSTWLGNILGIFDATGWVLDWISNWVFYAKEDLPQVQELRKRVEELKALRKEKYQLAAQLCEACIEDIQSDNTNNISEYFFLIKEAIKWYEIHNTTHNANDDSLEEEGSD
jgi:hypothetical protein